VGERARFGALRRWHRLLMSAVKAFWRATSPAFDGGSIEAA
jgi:hypothetical protein